MREFKRIRNILKEFINSEKIPKDFKRIQKNPTNSKRFQKNFKNPNKFLKIKEIQMHSSKWLKQAKVLPSSTFSIRMKNKTCPTLLRHLKRLQSHIIRLLVIPYNDFDNQ